MKRAVVWARDALDDVRTQIAFIAEENPVAARRVADRVRETAAALGTMATGRPGRLAGTYEKPVVRLPYIIAYTLRRIDGIESVVILRVIHTSRHWPPGEWPR